MEPLPKYTDSQIEERKGVYAFASAPFGQLKTKPEEGLALAQADKDLPRGRKRRRWKQELISTLQQAGQDMGAVSEQEIAKKIRAYRRERKKQPEIRLVPQAKTKTDSLPR